MPMTWWQIGLVILAVSSLINIANEVSSIAKELKKLNIFLDEAKKGNSK